MLKVYRLLKDDEIVKSSDEWKTDRMLNWESETTFEIRTVKEYRESLCRTYSYSSFDTIRWRRRVDHNHKMKLSKHEPQRTT